MDHLNISVEVYALKIFFILITTQNNTWFYDLKIKLRALNKMTNHNKYLHTHL